MEQVKKDNLQTLLQKKPSWLIRYGMYLVSALLLVFIICFFSYIYGPAELLPGTHIEILR
jgi:hypothetical protein